MSEDNQVYTKSNALIQGTIDRMTVKETKLMAVLLSEYKHYYDRDNSCTTTVLNRREFLNYLEINTGGMNYQVLDRVLEDFSAKARCKWFNQENKTNNITPYFTNIEYHTHEEEGNTDIVFEWNDRMTPLIIGLDANYTQMFRKNILSLRSKKAIVLYELLKSYSALDVIRPFTIEELRDRLDMNSKSYDVFTDFYKRGINEPIKEINENTDIEVSVKKIKDSRNKRKIKSLQFVIKNKGPKKVWFDEFQNIKLTETEYRTVTQEFYIDNEFVGKRLVAQLSKVKDEKPDSIRNDFRQLEKYYKAELKKHEKQKEEKKNIYNNLESLYANNNRHIEQTTIDDYLDQDEAVNILSKFD